MARSPDVEPVEREVVARPRPGVGEIAERAGRQVVDDVDLPALGEQPVGERRTDEPGAAGDERSHTCTPGGGTRAPESFEPAATTAPAPITLRSLAVASASSSAPRPITASTASAAGPSRASSSTHRADDVGAGLDDHAGTEHRRRRAWCPARRRHRPRGGWGPRPGHRRRRARSPAATRPARSRWHRRRAAVRPSRRARRACASRYFSGVPMSSQYASLWSAYRLPGCSSIRGNVSRSIETLRPGRDAVEHGRFEHVGAGVDPVGRRVAGAAASPRTPTTSPSASVGTTPNADGSSTRGRADRRLGAPLGVELQRARSGRAP